MESVRVPPVVALGEAVEITVVASDPLGVAAIELQLEGHRPQRVSADGGEQVVVSAPLLPTEAGYLALDVTAVGVDGARGEPVRELLPVGDHASDEPAEDPAELERRLRDWEAAGGDAYALYARGDLYRRGLPERAQAERAQAVRTLDAVRDRVGQLHPGLGQALAIHWWRSWLATTERQRFDWETHCGPNVTGVTPGGEVLECWLAMRPLVRAFMVWQEVDPNTGDVTTMAYDDWPFYLKNFLNVNFHHYWTWLEGGAGDDFPGIELASPPVNQVQLQDGQPAVTAFSGYEARSLYIQTVAHTLALEIGGFLPWSILEYGSFTDVARILSSEYLFHAGHYDTSHVDNPTPVVFNGWWPYGATTHAPPTVTFRFLVEENILRPTHYDTVARLMKWGRENMAHYAGGRTAENMEYHWGYRGDPPVARILSRWATSPNGTPLGWAAGCHGVAYFSQSLLRAANIPVAARKLHGTPAPVHRSPVFYTAGQALSHGDDIYAMRWLIPSVDPSYVQPDEVFISLQTFSQWFPGTVEGQTENVGRRFFEVVLDVLPNKLMDLYCDDLEAFASHADGSVHAFFSDRYSLAELEAMNLWSRLAAKEAKHDFCDEPVFKGPPVPFPFPASAELGRGTGGP